MTSSEEIIPPKTVLYCQKCGMPPEYCSYGPDFESHCLPWLKSSHPPVFKALFSGRKDKCEDAPKVSDIPLKPWTMEQRLTAFYEKYEPEKLANLPNLLVKYAGKEEQLFTALVKKYGDEPVDPYDAANEGEESDDDRIDKKIGEMSVGDKKKRRGAGAKKANKVDTRVIIQKISRNRKKAVTIVVGMDTMPGLKLKDVSKSFSKKFAGSSSVKDTATGTKEIIIQGDHTEDVAAMIVKTFKVPADAVFLDVDGEFVPFSG